MANNPFDMLNMFMNRGGNPQQILPMLAQKNPKFNEVMSQINNMSNGGNYQELAMQLAKQRGIDPNQLISLVKRMQGK